LDEEERTYMEIGGLEILFNQQMEN